MYCGQLVIEAIGACAMVVSRQGRPQQASPRPCNDVTLEFGPASMIVAQIQHIAMDACIRAMYAKEETVLQLYHAFALYTFIEDDGRCVEVSKRAVN